MSRFLRFAAAAAVLAAAFAFALAPAANADTGTIVVTQSNDSGALQTAVENVYGTAETIALAEMPGATSATVENLTDEPITVTVSGMSVSVSPGKSVRVPETGRGEIILTVPAGT